MNGKFQSSLVEGDFGSGLALRQSLCEGDFWMRREGCYLVYRGQDHADNIDYNRILAAPGEAGPITLPASVQHEAGRGYYYAVRRVSGTGKESGTRNVVMLALGADGELVPGRPGPVRGLFASQRSSGRIELIWRHWPAGEETSCDHFAVFGDHGTRSIDFEHPLAEIPCQGRNCYQFLSEPCEHGRRYSFGVRSVSADGQDDGSTASVSIEITLSASSGRLNIRSSTCL
jgi:hypothetical protein